MRVIFDYESGKKINSSEDSDKLGKEIATFIEGSGLMTGGQFEFKTTQGQTRFVAWQATPQQPDVVNVHITQYR